MSDFFNNCKDWISNITNDATGSILIGLGSHVQEVALILIGVGFLLLICRNTKVLRWGFISYMLGLLIELIGISLIK